MSDAEDRLTRKIKRLKEAKQQAEKLLEDKTRELFLLNKDLEGQVEERTLELKKARDQAVAASEAKTQFLANMSHEIRTPLNGMIGFISLLEKSELSDIQREQLQTVSKSGQLLLSLISDILDFTKIEAGKLKMERRKFHLKNSIEDIIRVLSQGAFEKQLEMPIYLDEKLPRSILSDEARIRQVLLNLIGNAIKFTDSGEVSIRVLSRGLSNGKHQVYFEVSDTGVGIPETKLESIFESFEQADLSDTRKYGGTGLGLAISSRIVESLGGKLEVKSELAFGSTFSFTVPFEVSADVNDLPTVRNLEGRRVAIQVTSQSIGRNISTRLHSWNAQVVPTSEFTIGATDVDHLILDYKSAEKYWQRLPKNQPTVVLCTPQEMVQSMKSPWYSMVQTLTKPLKREKLFESLTGTITQLEPIQNPSETPSENINFTGSKILLVEDNVINQQVALAMLQSHGYVVDVANNGLEAVEKMTSSKDYSLILMDCQMPEMDGLDATKEIRKTNHQIPIIAMTANAFTETKERCMQVGMNDFITKPVTDDVLVNVITKNLQESNRSQSAGVA